MVGGSRAFGRRRIGPVAIGLAALFAVAPAALACPPAPLAACRVAGQNSLSVTRASSPASNRLTWSWSGGSPTLASEFGDPTATSGYELCVYDATGLVASFAVPAAGTCDGRPCWQTTASGFQYKGHGSGAAGVRTMTLSSSGKPSARVRLEARGADLPGPILPLAAPLTVQLAPADGSVCFESVFDGNAITRDDTARLSARADVNATTPLPPLPSEACGTALTSYASGVSSVDSLVHDGLTRTFRVYVPPSYDVSGDTPAPVLVLLHGGFGSGQQIESSSRILEVADANGFLVVSPDGVAGSGGVRTWNASGCCGYAAANGVDDVGFISSLLDRLQANVCVDRRRIYAAGMSNGAMLSHRLGCDLAGRIRAVGSVAGAQMTDPCSPARPVAMIEIHGTGDLNVPYDGGMGCGPSAVAYPSVEETIAGWLERDGCSGVSSVLLEQGDGTCLREGKCAGATDVALCTIPNGGHHWPGGDPPAVTGFSGCPFGYQSETFSASQVLWQFFSQHPPR